MDSVAFVSDIVIQSESSFIKLFLQRRYGNERDGNFWRQ